MYYYFHSVLVLILQWIKCLVVYWELSWLCSLTAAGRKDFSLFLLAVEMLPLSSQGQEVKVTEDTRDRKLQNKDPQP